MEKYYEDVRLPNEIYPWASKAAFFPRRLNNTNREL